MIEPLVLLPGLMCDARLFAAQITALSHERAVMVGPIFGGERIEEIASGLLDQLPHRFALSGFGLGGSVALEIARRAPERVTRLCLLATDAQADTPHIAASREDLIVGAQAGRLDEVMRKVIGSDMLAPGPQRIPILNNILQMAAAVGPEVFVRQMRALQRRPDQQSTLRRIKIPTLIVCGAHDADNPVRKHTFLADLIPDAELRVIDRAGHFPTLETPETVNEMLRDWLQIPLRLA
ncbi:Pimeloyl-ACP methyl ester carboxylesterase [Ruegeria halocynthiae]|uniref:Pimeloyl-ACP methyl ester carboxylesterase n=1 Tax=Ruegeria halocynthiae TaxID=985054 RepID=A0A1H2UNN8_9RHOB|nr:alpha/beta fold hydrolase [Ruegeria halocynthiae]SDW57721.1 Pimeloyl-ACP methyl ester carboxylesterase [Ruegeria halocynthiae]